ncbi:hypothetical protein [Chryseobacterium aquaticum]|uniref:hypothetical protein n=1 Tax=Chryseobacterium aquaticum TaxID=452084 RepID=UPI002FCBDCBB
MKKNLLVRLYLTMIALLSVHSCRQDILPDKESYNNTSAFQLTSKRISLTEAKHKAKLLPEIKKAETEFKKLKTSAFGKTVNYGNGVSIDTESVIFIENGPNYHTYTFNVTSENTSADAPLENLLLTPLPDGTYKKLLISYNFTEQEKQIINSGGYVNTKGKSKVTDLGKGTLYDIVSKSQSCGYVEAQAYTICSEGVHFHGESNCNADVKSQLITVYLWKCESIDDGSGTSGGGSSPGSGPGEGGGGSPCPDCPTDGGSTPTEPCNGNGVLTGPLDPTTDIGDGTCTGVPTLPNPGLPIKTNPCQKTKAMLENPAVQTKLDSLKNHSTGTGELGFKTKKDGTTSGIINGGKHAVDMGIKAGYQGGYHNHTSTGIPMHSAPDIESNLLAFARAQPTGEHKNAYFGMVVKKVCTSCPGGFKTYNYIMRFDGEYSDALTSFSQLDIDKLKIEYSIKESKLSDPTGSYGSTYIDSAGNLTNEGLEVLFFDTVKKMGLTNKIILQRIEDDVDGTVNNITLNPDGLHTTANPCI